MWLVGSLLPEALPDYMVNPVLSSCCNTGFKENIAFVQATHNDDNATSLLQPWRHTKVFLFLRQFIGDEIIVNWLESKGEYMSKKSETVYPRIWVFWNCLSWSTRKSSKLSIKTFLKRSIKFFWNLSQYFSNNVEEYHQLALRFQFKGDSGVCAG